MPAELRAGYRLLRMGCLPPELEHAIQLLDYPQQYPGRGPDTIRLVASSPLELKLRQAKLSTDFYTVSMQKKLLHKINDN